MISNEDLAKQLKLITQNAWRVESNTTVNTICEYIIREALQLVLESLQEDFIQLEHRLEMLEDASTDGGFQEPEWSKKTQNKGRGNNAKARTTNGANAL